MSQANKDVLAAFLTALGTGDVEGLKRTLTPNAVAIATGTSMMAGSRNYEEILGVAGMLNQVTKDGIVFNIVSMTAEDNRVAAEVEGRSTLVNGTPYNNTYAFIATIEDGKIAQLKEYFCGKLAEEVLGPIMAG